MGIIRAAGSAVHSTMDSQWKEFFLSEALPDDILIVRGHKLISDRSVNTREDDEIITNGSVIVVSDGLAAVVVSGGRVIDVCTEPGEYIFQDPERKTGLGGLLQEAGTRITFGGDFMPLTQRVYFINTRECMNNPFSSAFPLSLSSGTGAPSMDLTLSVSGVFSYRIEDPALFYTLVSGNVADNYGRIQLNRQIASEILTALGPALSACSPPGMRPSEAPEMIESYINQLRGELENGWCGSHGLSVTSLTFDTFRILDAVYVQQNQHAAALAGQAPADRSLSPLPSPAGPDPSVQDRSSVPPRSDRNHILDALQHSSGAALADAIRGRSPAQSPAGWTCSCGAASTGNFCPACGAPRPSEWTCTCGHRNLGRFCAECGLPQPPLP